MSAIDPRLDRLERLVDRVQEQINQLHSSSMTLVTTAFAEMERRLTDKLDRQTGEIAGELDKLREKVVPMSEHEHLMQRVDTLWTQNVGAQSEWESISKQVPILWDERTRIRAALAISYGLMTSAGIAAGIWAAFHR